MELTAKTNLRISEPLPHEQTVIVFSGLVLAMLLAALDSTIVATALPTIVDDLGGLAHLSWVVTAYLLAQTIVTPLYGKLGDLYGRKGVLQSAIVLFLLGSALCGLSRSMTQLIVFRAIQGLGGGGLLVTTQAVVGDVVPPRDRGRYQGFFGAVFALASVAGPLLGGYFTSNVSWRWIFYVNLPVGAVALAVIGFALKSREGHGEHVIDYTGAALLAVALSAIVLLCDLAPLFSWSSPIMIGLSASVLIALALFVVVENRASEPVLPIHLFKNRVFLVTSAISLIVGVALFGSVTYMPLFLQVVKGSSPTVSGLELTPMMGGIVLTSVASGQLISRIGRYKWFPIVGTALTTFGLFLLSRLTPDSSTRVAAAMMLCLGLGLGMVMQVMIIAVQNAVEYSDLGVATSGAILFRLIGGAFGTAVLGGVFSAFLSRNLAGSMSGAGVSADLTGAALSPEALSQLPPNVAHAYAASFTGALDTMFVVAACIAFVAFLLSWLLPELPLRKTLATVTGENSGTSAAQAFPLPSDPDSLSVLARGIIAVANRDVRRRYISAIVRRAGLELEPVVAWLLVKIEENPNVDLGELSRSYNVEHPRLENALGQLIDARLVTPIRGADGQKPRYGITAEGCAVFNRLVKARREHLTEISSEWSPTDREKVSALLTQLAQHLVPETRGSEVRDQKPEVRGRRSAASDRA